jgi:hypothetical protein
LSVAITIVSASGGTVPYKVYGGSASGSGTNGSGTGGSGTGGSGTGGSGTGGSGTGGSGAHGSGVRPSGTASGVVVGGHAAYTVAFGWQSFPSNQVSASEVNDTSASPAS